MEKTYLYIWESLRPKHWIKNLLIFSEILFSQNIFVLSLLLKVVIAFLLFCLLSSAGYIINDITDLERDRSHPLKSQRPLASGKLKVSHAVSVLIIIVPLSLAVSFYLDLSFFFMAAAYFLLQLAYSFYLKQIVILDVFTIACGFVLRVLAGAFIIDVEISSWLIICTILLSLFLGMSKRRYELVLLEQDAKNHRDVLSKYSPYLLDQMLSVVTASTVVAYALYTISPETTEKFGTRNLIFTIPFVLYGILRYLYLIHQKETGGSPEKVLLTDKPLMIDIFLWAITAGLILYL